MALANKNARIFWAVMTGNKRYDAHWLQPLGMSRHSSRVGSLQLGCRLLRAHGQNAHRGRARAPQASRKPTTHIAQGPRQVWCWDMRPQVGFLFHCTSDPKPNPKRS